MNKPWPNKVVVAILKDKNSWLTAARLSKLYSWCSDNLSSEGVLWKHEHIGYNRDNSCYECAFYFAQSGDAVLFKLTNGV